jgi:nitrous oxide reductase accessory protein NosL
MRLFVLAIMMQLAVAVSVLAAVPPQPGPKDRCPVCGMFVAPYHDWVAAIEFRDGTRFYFDGPKDLFVCFFDLSTYRKGASLTDIAGVYVTEYYSAELVDAREVFFVTDSDVLGPMGLELVPVRGRDAAETFRRDHGGQRILSFNGSELIEVAPRP